MINSKIFSKLGPRAVERFGIRAVVTGVSHAQVTRKRCVNGDLTFAVWLKLRLHLFTR